MQATPTKSTIKLTTISTAKLTPTSATLSTLEGISGVSGPTTKTIKTSVTKKSTTTTTTLQGLNANENTTASKEIEEISKKISEHADAIYRTWKCRGLAPTELLDIYTNAATVQATQVGADIFGGSVEAAAAVGTTEGLQKFVSQFVIKDKEQRGVKTSGQSVGGGGGGGVNALSLLKSQRTDSTIATSTAAIIMPENIGSKMTQKSGVGNVISGGVLKQTSRTTTGIQKPTASSTNASNAILMKSSNNNEQVSVKKLAKTPSVTPATSSSLSSKVAASSITSSSPLSTTSIKNNACVKNVNNIVGVSKQNANTTPTTVKRNFGKSAITNTPKTMTAPMLDINLNLDLGFNDLQLDVNNLSQLQTQNLFKIKELIKENENGNDAIKEPKKTTTTKIANKTKRANSPAKIVVVETTMTVTDSPNTTKLKATKSTINNEQQMNNNNDVNVKKIAKNLTNNHNNNKSNNKNNINNNNINSMTSNNIKSIGELNDNATINKMISTNDKMNSTLKQQTGAKATTATKTITNKTPLAITTATKSAIEQSPTIKASTTITTGTIATATITTTPMPTTIPTTNVGELAHQSIKVINSISNGSQAEQQLSQNEQNVTTQKLNKKFKENNINSNNNNNNKINESEFKKNSNKLIKVEKVNNTTVKHLKASIEETGAATANVMEIARQSNNSNISSTTSGISTSSSNMPAPTKFKSGRATLSAAQDKNLRSPFLTRGSVAERVLIFEKCPDARNSFLNIKRPDPLDTPPKSLLKAKLHATPPPPPEQRSLQQEVRNLKSVYIPRFYFPHGKPQPQIAQERMLRNILGAFDSYPNNQVTKDELPRILKLCGLPFYWRMPVMVFCQQQNNVGLVERQRFVEFWKQMNVYCHDAASRFVYILSRGQRFRSYIVPEDMVPLVQDVVDTHPGLAFLKEATEFHSRYVHTVIARIFYSVNRSWSGKITMSELKKSDLLEIISLLEEEDDINQIMAFFSYEHFYVIYCKFWELDKDHDLLINQDDLARHSDHALSTRIVERIFSGCVTRNDKKKNPNDEPKMSYTDFVWFLLSEEDKRTPTAIEYWFRCMDLDGDGVLSMYELEYFYEEQQQRMESIGIETLPFEDCLCQMLDMIKPQQRDAITLGDLKRCKMTHVFFDTFFNLEKYLDHEQRDPFASQRDEYTSDWDRFAAQEYELLISEEND